MTVYEAALENEIIKLEEKIRIMEENDKEALKLICILIKKLGGKVDITEADTISFDNKTVLVRSRNSMNMTYTYHAISEQGGNHEQN